MAHAPVAHGAEPHGEETIPHGELPQGAETTPHGEVLQGELQLVEHGETVSHVLTT